MKCPGLRLIGCLLQRTSENNVPANFGEYPLQRLSGNSVENMMVAYALRHGKQEIPHGSVRRRMEVHPRRRLLRPEEWLPLAVVA